MRGVTLVSSLSIAQLVLCCVHTLAALQYTITLRKPMGLQLEEQEPGLSGLSVRAVLPEGSAHASDRVWPGDILVGINGRDLYDETSFTYAMMQLQTAGPTAELTFCRDLSRVVAVRFPIGTVAFGTPGDSLGELALTAGYEGIRYNCRTGTCGTCEVVLRTGDKVRTVRACSGRIPDARRQSLTSFSQPGKPQACHRRRTCSNYRRSSKRRSRPKSGGGGGPGRAPGCVRTGCESNADTTKIACEEGVNTVKKPARGGRGMLRRGSGWPRNCMMEGHRCMSIVAVVGGSMFCLEGSMWWC